MKAPGEMRVPKDRAEVEAYLAKLQYALEQEGTRIEFQRKRHVDRIRQPENTNDYTMGELFPDESRTQVLRRELALLEVADYIETVKDARFPKRSDLWVFGKRYGAKDVYIKFRVEVVGASYVFVLSFHFSTVPFSAVRFPFA